MIGPLCSAAARSAAFGLAAICTCAPSLAPRTAAASCSGARDRTSPTVVQITCAARSAGDVARAALNSAIDLSAITARINTSGALCAPLALRRCGARSPSAADSAAAPSSLCAPSRSRSRSSPPPSARGISSMRPGHRAAANPARSSSSLTEAMPASRSASSVAAATAAFAPWCRPSRPTRTAPRPSSSTSMPSRPSDRVAPARAIVNGAPTRCARWRITSSAPPRSLAPITARSPRTMIAAFSLAIASIVSPKYC